MEADGQKPAASIEVTARAKVMVIEVFSKKGLFFARSAFPLSSGLSVKRRGSSNRLSLSVYLKLEILIT